MRGSGIMLRRLNDALPGLVLGIIVYGAAVFLAGIWFVPDKLRFTTGLAIGIALACGMAVNMAVVLRDAVETADCRLRHNAGVRSHHICSHPYHAVQESAA